VVGIRVTDLLNEHLKKRPSKKASPRSYFYISEAGKHPLDIFRALTDPHWVPPKIRRLQEIGTATHKRACKLLREMGMLEQAEVGLGDDLFRGYADAIIRIPGKGFVVLEIKTVGRKEFDTILRRGVPTWHAYIQLQLYLHYLGMSRGIILLIENNALEDFLMPLEEYRASQRMKEFRIRRNPKIIGQTIRKFGKMKEEFVKAGAMKE